MVSYSSVSNHVLDSGRNVTFEKIGLKSSSLQNCDTIELILDEAHFNYAVNLFSYCVFVPLQAKNVLSTFMCTK